MSKETTPKNDLANSRFGRRVEIDPRSAGRIPDFAWINKKLPIADVARKLGLNFGTNHLIHCWHPDLHHNGDRTASVGIRPLNNTVKCFGCACDGGPFGPIDLVMDVLNLDSLAQAGTWIVEHFEVPFLPKGKHLKQPSRRIVRAGFEGDIGLLVQSGLWSKLSVPARCIVPVLLQFAREVEGKPTCRIEMSYRAISRYSGVKSPNAVARALRELEQIKWLRRETAPSDSVVRATNLYILTPQSDELRELANTMTRQKRDEIKAEREFRRQNRCERLKLLTTSKEKGNSQAFTKYKTLYSSNTVEQIHAIRRIPRILCAGRASPEWSRTCRTRSPAWRRRVATPLREGEQAVIDIT
jgi:hypothetical protein